MHVFNVGNPVLSKSVSENFQFGRLSEESWVWTILFVYLFVLLLLLCFGIGKMMLMSREVSASLQSVF